MGPMLSKTRMRAGHPLLTVLGQFWISFRSVVGGGLGVVGCCLGVVWAPFVAD